MQDHPTQKCCCCGEQKPLAEYPFLDERRVRKCEACRSRPNKTCTDCGLIHPIDNFAWQTASTNKKRYRGSVCKTCRARRCREWNAKYSKTKVLNRNLLKSFGITLDDYNAMLLRQDGVCAICGRPPEATDHRNQRLQVDHCHECGDVRQLLCSTCNNGLGCFKDNLKLLEKAIQYLQEHRHNSLRSNDQEG